MAKKILSKPKKKFDRKSLKEPDQFLESAKTFSDWASHHLVIIIISIAVICVGTATFFGYRLWRDQQIAKASVLYFQFVKELGNLELTKNSKGDQNLSKNLQPVQRVLSKIEQRFSQTAPAQLAQLEYASLLKKNGEETQALAIYQKLLDQGARTPLIAGLSAINLAYLYELKSEWKKALSAFKRVKNNPYPFLKVDSAWGQARCYKALGELERGKAIYDEIISTFPSTSFARKSKVLKDLLTEK